MSESQEFETNDELVNYLTPWVEEELLQSLLRLYLYRDIYWSWNEALAMTSEEILEYGHFHGWVRSGYVAFVVMAVRRELDRGDDARSLRCFLGAIRDNAALLDKDWFYSRTSRSSVGDSGLDDTWARISVRGGVHVDPVVVQADIDLLFEQGKKTYDWATAYLAHSLEGRVQRSNPTFGEIHSMIDQLERVWRRWHVISTATTVGDLRPEPWEPVLTVPWITSEQASELHDRRIAGGPCVESEG